MTKDNAVTFKGGKEGIIILLDENADFEQIKAVLTRKAQEASKFFADAGISIVFKGKKLIDGQMAELLGIINSETDLDVTAVEDLTGKIKTIDPASKDEIATPDTHFHMGSLRSGQSITQNGSVVIMGDVNAGAEVMATGNVVVMGAVRGLIQAGSSGDESAYIGAVSLQPQQYLSIAGKRVHYTKEALDKNKVKEEPQYVFMKDGNIYIEFMANIK